MAKALSIEVESGTYRGPRLTRRHNGYYAGDFSRSPLRDPSRPTFALRPATAL